MYKTGAHKTVYNNYGKTHTYISLSLSLPLPFSLTHSPPPHPFSTIIIMPATRCQLLCLFQPRLYCWVSGVHVLAVLAVRPLHTWQLPAERVGGWHAGGYLIRAGKREGKEAVILQAEGLGGMGACWHLGTEGWCCGLNLPVSAQQSPCLVVESSWALRS